MLMVYVKLDQEFSFLCLLMPYSSKQNRFNVFSDCIFYNARRGRNYASAGIRSQALTTFSKWGFSMTGNSLGAVTLDLSLKLPLGKQLGSLWVLITFVFSLIVLALFGIAYLASKRPGLVTLHSRPTLRNSPNALTKLLSAQTLLQPIIIVMNLYIIDIWFITSHFDCNLYIYFYIVISSISIYLCIISIYNYLYQDIFLDINSLQCKVDSRSTSAIAAIYSTCFVKYRTYAWWGGGGYCHIWAIQVNAAAKGMVFKQFTLGQGI